MNKLGILTVPYICNDTHYNLTKASYESWSHVDAYRIAIVNRKRGRRSNDIELLGKHNDVVGMNDMNILARAWNMGIKIAIKHGCDYIFIPNLDVVMHPDAITNLMEFAQNHPESILWSCQAIQSIMDLKTFPIQNSWKQIVNHDQSYSAFMISKKTLREVGYFYEGFKPCYFEDDDYLRRCSLRGFPSYRYEGSLFYHFGMGTIRNDEHTTFNRDYEANKIHYIERWGGIPGEEKYDLPQVNVTIKERTLSYLDL